MTMLVHVFLNVTIVIIFILFKQIDILKLEKRTYLINKIKENYSYNRILIKTF